MVDKSFLVEVNKADVSACIETIQQMIRLSSEHVSVYDEVVATGIKPPDSVTIAAEYLRASINTFTALQERLALALALHATKGKYDNVP